MKIVFFFFLRFIRFCIWTAFGQLRILYDLFFVPIRSFFDKKKNLKGEKFPFETPFPGSMKRGEKNIV